MPTELSDAFAAAVRVAITPLFILSGIALFLIIYTNRLGRVDDRLRTIAGARRRSEGWAITPGIDHEIGCLRRRMIVVNCSIISFTFGGLCLAVVILLLFVNEIVFSTLMTTRILVFGLCCVSVVVALGCFLYELWLSRQCALPEFADLIPERSNAP